jgi:hypothetical protein
MATSSDSLLSSTSSGLALLESVQSMLNPDYVNQVTTNQGRRMAIKLLNPDYVNQVTTNQGRRMAIKLLRDDEMLIKNSVSEHTDSHYYR